MNWDVACLHCPETGYVQLLRTFDYTLYMAKTFLPHYWVLATLWDSGHTQLETIYNNNGYIAREYVPVGDVLETVQRYFPELYMEMML